MRYVLYFVIGLCTASPLAFAAATLENNTHAQNNTPVRSPKSLKHPELATGFNNLSGEITYNRCLKNKNSDVHQERHTHLTSQIIHSSKEAFDFFSLSDKGEIGGGVNQFNASASYAHSLSRKLHQLEQETTVAVKLWQENNQFKLKGKPKLKNYAKNWLNSETLSGEINFRRYCGDGYVRQLTTGKELAFMIQVSSKTESLESTQKVALEISAAYSQMVSGSIGITTEDISKRYSKNYQFKIVAYLSGSKTTISDINLKNFAEKVLEFEKEDSDVESVLSYQTNYYPENNEVSHWERYADYRPALKSIHAWEDFMNTSFARMCQSKDASFMNAEVNTLCHRTETSYKRFLGECSTTLGWPNCLPPHDNACLLDDGTQCDRLNDWHWEDNILEGGCTLFGNNAGCRAVLSCPIDFKISAARASCDLEYPDTPLFLGNWGFLRVIKASVLNHRGRCAVNSQTISKGSVKLTLDKPQMLALSCQEKDPNGGDCQIKAEVQCTGAVSN
jgi:hypothetical protein